MDQHDVVHCINLAEGYAFPTYMMPTPTPLATILGRGALAGSAPAGALWGGTRGDPEEGTGDAGSGSGGQGGEGERHPPAREVHAAAALGSNIIVHGGNSRAE